MEVAVIRSGMMTTVQDLGRKGHLSQGVPWGGAADSFAMRVANMLVGNPEDAAGLEVTLTGPELEFAEAAWIAVCGARFEGIPSWRPIRVEAGARVSFGKREQGCRACLAVAGGFDVPVVLGGKGTFLAGSFGGFEGRQLRDGDILRTIGASRELSGHWSLDERVLPRYSREPVIRVMPGTHAADFGESLYSGRFAVTARSNRMGTRLDGAKLIRPEAADLVSSAVAPGTIQVPPDGNPIVLMADAQTLGGYPRVAHVASVDMPLLAQLAPGDGVRFERTSVREAHAMAHASEHALALLHQGIAEKVRPA
ncbi:MAG TPA: biotin-dependent carboxyltransferase family protein [Opitutaceae bacterium]|jgi:antagonist of KipI|nr:biotin-dependent carboxyltransferase family protein [Opitutaceae bacterium]